jgi:bacillopeptidase F (M6 metalloprotease family)
MDVDLTAYAGKRVRIGFYHSATRDAYNTPSESTGWYIDDIQLVIKVPQLSGDFEAGWGDWSADRGLWEVGTPTAGPSSCHSGSQCVGTVLSGNYANLTDSRLISPTMLLPGVGGDEALLLRFWHWYSYSTYDSGAFQISSWDGEKWSDWSTISQLATGNSNT